MGSGGWEKEEGRGKRGRGQRGKGKEGGREAREGEHGPAEMVGVALPRPALLQGWFIPRYGRYLAAALVVLALHRWVCAHVARPFSVSLTGKETETETCTAAGGAKSDDARAARSGTSVSSTGIRTHRASQRESQTRAHRRTERVRRSAQQSWRNVVVTLPTGRVLRVVTEKDATARCVCAHKAIERGAAPTACGMCDNDCAALGADSSWSGGSIWESSELLAQILIEKPPHFWQSHPRVLELGAGCGLVSISAAAMGAQYVVATDQIIRMAQLNVEANFPPGSTERKRIDVRSLRWGSTEDMSTVLSLRSTWPSHEDTLAESAKELGPATAQRAPYDLILGADCIYSRDNHARVATTVDFMANSGATVLW